jgi:hypothetical protein
MENFRAFSSDWEGEKQILRLRRRMTTKKQKQKQKQKQEQKAESRFSACGEG